jgi:hypothetical protein
MSDSKVILGIELGNQHQMSACVFFIFLVTGLTKCRVFLTSMYKYKKTETSWDTTKGVSMIAWISLWNKGRGPSLVLENIVLISQPSSLNHQTSTLQLQP